MTTSTGNSLNGAAGAGLGTLANWILRTGSDHVVIDADGVGAHPSNASIVRYSNSNFTPAVDGETYTMGFDIYATSTSFQFGPMGRCQPDASGYLMTYADPAAVGIGGGYSLYRYNSGTLTEIVHLLGTQVLAAGPHTMSMRITGTGASVAIECFVDGVQIGSTYTDTSAGRINTLGTRGLWAFGACTSTTGVSITSVSASDTVSAGATFSPTGATSADGYIFQRSGSTGTVAAAGSYTGTPASIEARLVDATTGVALAGFDWAVKVASPSGGAYSFSFANVPQGGFYKLQLRDSAVPGTVTAPGNSFGVGVRVILIGQSNIETLSMYNTGTPSPMVRVYDRYRNVGTWTSPTLGTGAINLGTALVAALGGAIPVGLIQYAMSGAGLHSGAGFATATSGGVARYWLDLSASAGTPWYDFITAIGVIGAGCELVVYGQGESDAMANISVSTYGADLVTLFGRIRTLLGAGVKIILPLLGQTNVAATSATAWDTVRQAQIATAAADGNAYPVSKQDLQCDAASPDMTAAQLEVWGTRLGQKIAYTMGLLAYGDGPRIASVTAISSTVYEVTLAHQGGTDITPSAATQIVDLLFKDSSAATITPSGVARYASNKIRATFTAAPAGPITVQSSFGKVPATQAGIARDNTNLTLPLQSSAPIQSGAVMATTAAFSVVDGSSSHAPVTGVANLDYSFFDQARLKDRLAPIKKGSTLSISAGVATIDITGLTALTPGQVGSVDYESADGSVGGRARVTVF